MYKEKRYYIAIIIIVIAFWVASFKLPFDETIKRITTTTTLIGAVVVWLQLKRGERLNESNFIMNLNNQFVGNKDMTLVEHELEQSYNQYQSMCKDNENISDEDLKKLRLGLNQSRTSEECQKLINYLVYLEALAALVYRKVLHLDVIDNLFSYRFFIAVNNPIVQQNEIFPYADYYQGIFQLSKMWTEKKIKKGIYIPMHQFDLCSRYEDYKNGKNVMDPIQISTAKSIDKKIDIARCIYEADHIIYPEAFGEDTELAAKAISRIIGMDNCLFDYNHLLVARYNGQICGACVYNDGTARWDRDDIKNRIGDKYLSKSQEEGYYYASEKYFEKVCDEKPDSESIELVAFGVEEGFRRKQIGTRMLEALIERNKEKNIILTVLANNIPAIELYEKEGFVNIHVDKEGCGTGFAPKGLHRPMINIMERKAQ